MARPKIEIDEDQVFKLAAMHCTNLEIAAFFGCSVATITGRFLEILDTGRRNGKIKLRKLQWANAEGGCFKMQIWLGKQYLRQADKTYEEIDQSITIRHEYGKLPEPAKKPVDEVRRTGALN